MLLTLQSVVDTNDSCTRRCAGADKKKLFGLFNQTAWDAAFSHC